jgi:hypothetical protein
VTFQSARLHMVGHALRVSVIGSIDARAAQVAVAEADDGPAGWDQSRCERHRKVRHYGGADSDAVIGGHERKN